MSGVLEAVERLEGKVAGREVAKFLISCSFKREGRGQVVEVLLRDGVVGDDELTHAEGLAGTRSRQLFGHELRHYPGQRYQAGLILSQNCPTHSHPQ